MCAVSVVRTTDDLENSIELVGQKQSHGNSHVNVFCPTNYSAYIQIMHSYSMLIVIGGIGLANVSRVQTGVGPGVPDTVGGPPPSVQEHYRSALGSLAACVVVLRSHVRLNLHLYVRSAMPRCQSGAAAPSCRPLPGAWCGRPSTQHSAAQHWMVYDWTVYMYACWALSGHCLGIV